MTLRVVPSMPQSPPLDPPGASEDRLRALVGPAAAGDRAAQAALLEAVAPAAAVVVRIVLGPSHADLDDVVQDALVCFLRAVPTFRGESSLMHFARTIAFRRALEVKRRGRNIRRLLGLYHRQEDLMSERPPLPVEELAQRRRHRLLRELLEDLPAAQAEALGLRVMVGASLEEVAAAAGVPANTIRSRLRLAREALRRRIEREPGFDELAEEAAP
jgi:RNA polymerase sigma-70 factor (ECF subfamily)